MTSCTGSVRGGFGKIWESQSWVLPRRKTVDFRLLAEALRRVRTCWWGCRWKSQNRKNVYLSPYVEEPLDSKVIKSFVPELRSRKCFSCSGIPMFYVYMLWTFYVRFTRELILFIYWGLFTYPYLALLHLERLSFITCFTKKKRPASSSKAWVCYIWFKISSY